MKLLSLKKIVVVCLLIPVLGLADSSWNDTKDDSKSYYAGENKKEETLIKSCHAFCATNYGVKQGTYKAVSDKNEASCTCSSKGSATLKENE